jgi:hypothetical protein
MPAISLAKRQSSQQSESQEALESGHGEHHRPLNSSGVWTFDNIGHGGEEESRQLERQVSDWRVTPQTRHEKRGQEDHSNTHLAMVDEKMVSRFTYDKSLGPGPDVY